MAVAYSCHDTSLSISNGLVLVSVVLSSRTNLSVCIYLV